MALGTDRPSPRGSTDKGGEESDSAVVVAEPMMTQSQLTPSDDPSADIESQ